MTRERLWWLAIGVAIGVFFSSLFWITRSYVQVGSVRRAMPQIAQNAPPVPRIAPQAPVTHATPPPVPVIAPTPQVTQPPVASIENVMKEFGLEGVFSANCDHLPRVGFFFNDSRPHLLWYQRGGEDVGKSVDEVIEAELMPGRQIHLVTVALKSERVGIKVGDKSEEVYQNTGLNRFRIIMNHNLDRGTYYIRDGMMALVSSPTPSSEIVKCAG